MTFLNPLGTLIPKIPFSFFAEFWVRVTSQAPGISLSRILGSPFWWREGSSQRAISSPPPPGVENPPTSCRLAHRLLCNEWLSGHLLFMF